MHRRETARKTRQILGCAAGLLLAAGAPWGQTIQVTGEGASPWSIPHAAESARDDALDRAHRQASLWAERHCPEGTYHVVGGPSFGPPLYTTGWGGLGRTTYWLDLEVEVACGRGWNVYQAWADTTGSGQDGSVAGADASAERTDASLVLHGTGGAAFQVWAGPDVRTVAGYLGGGSYSPDGGAELALDVPAGLGVEHLAFFVVTGGRVRAVGPPIATGATGAPALATGTVAAVEARVLPSPPVLVAARSGEERGEVEGERTGSGAGVPAAAAPPLLGQVDQFWTRDAFVGL